jgi:CheY-like chemotaxis protein
VILWTYQRRKKDENKARNAGCSDYLAKPIMDYKILQRKIEKFLK